MTAAMETCGLGKRYRGVWALRDCTMQILPGRVVALVGPNGAGKTTLLQLATGLAAPTTGSVEIFGCCPRDQTAKVLPRLAFVAQDRPLFRNFSVAEMLKVGRKLNPRWDGHLAHSRVADLAIPLDRKVSRLSGGQQAQLSLVMALAKRPELLLLDEPVAALDPLARREFLQTLMASVVEDGMTALLSSHIITDLERICDHLVILSQSEVQLAGDIEDIQGSHKLLVGPRSDADGVAHIHHVLQVNHTERQTTLLVQLNGHVWDASWQVHDVPLEDIVLAYLGSGKRNPTAPPPTQTREMIGA